VTNIKDGERLEIGEISFIKNFENQKQRKKKLQGESAGKNRTITVEGEERNLYDRGPKSKSKSGERDQASKQKKSETGGGRNR